MQFINETVRFACECVCDRASEREIKNGSKCRYCQSVSVNVCMLCTYERVFFVCLLKFILLRFTSHATYINLFIFALFLFFPLPKLEEKLWPLFFPRKIMHFCFHHQHQHQHRRHYHCCCHYCCCCCFSFLSINLIAFKCIHVQRSLTLSIAFLIPFPNK